MIVIMYDEGGGDEEEPAERGGRADADEDRDGSGARVVGRLFGDVGGGVVCVVMRGEREWSKWE